MLSTILGLLHHVALPICTGPFNGSGQARATGVDVEVRGLDGEADPSLGGGVGHRLQEKSGRLPTQSPPFKLVFFSCLYLY